MIKNVTGDLLAAEADALVNTVNMVGVMGKGIALQFKRAYPAMFKEYARAARAGEVRRGRMHVWPTGAITGPAYIISFPTKGHWRSPSRLEDIEAGLDDLVSTVRRLGIRSIAVPPLGAGNGGLDWKDVEPLIGRAFAALPEVAVLLYPPGSPPQAAEMRDLAPAPRMPRGSRPTVYKYMDDGRLDFVPVGRHRRISAEALTRFQAEEGERRDEALDELAQFSNEHGLVD